MTHRSRQRRIDRCTASTRPGREGQVTHAALAAGQAEKGASTRPGCEGRVTLVVGHDFVSACLLQRGLASKARRRRPCRTESAAWRCFNEARPRRPGDAQAHVGIVQRLIASTRPDHKGQVTPAHHRRGAVGVQASTRPDHEGQVTRAQTTTGEHMTNASTRPDHEGQVTRPCCSAQSGRYRFNEARPRRPGDASRMLDNGWTLEVLQRGPTTKAR